MGRESSLTRMIIHQTGAFIVGCKTMQLDWRTISGPALTIAAALSAIAAARLLPSSPNPAPLFVCIVALAGSLSGLGSGLASAALALGLSALFFSGHGVPIGHSAA